MPNNDYILRSDAKNAITSEWWTEIDRVPAADVKPVIRCRDCKNSFMCDPGGIRCTKILNNGKYMPVEGDFFCAFGKRKEADDAEVH